MFERYTERARRVLFFARYEASQLGSISIETEHLLLGLIREGKGLTSRIFARSHLSLEEIRKEIEGRTVVREKVSTSVEIPISTETKRALQFAAEEADRLLHNYVGTEHVLLGILCEERCVAASILVEKGMRLGTVREDIVQLLNEKTTLTRVKETPLLAEFSRDLTESAMKNLLDPSEGTTGNILYSINEVYVESDGIDRHMAQGMQWEHFMAFAGTIMEYGKVLIAGGSVIHSMNE